MACTFGYGALAFLLCAGAVLVDPRSAEPMGPVKDLPLMLGGLLLLPWVVWAGHWKAFLRSGVGMGICAVLAAALVSVAGAINCPVAYEELLRMFLLAVTACAAAQVEWTPSRLRVLALLALVGAGVNSVCVLAEHFEWSWKLYTRENRLLGLFSHQNDLAQFLSIAIVMGFVSGVRGKEGAATVRSAKLSGAPTLILITLSSIALVLTLSRGAWLGTLAGVGYLLWRRGGVRTRIAEFKFPLVFLVMGISLGALLVSGDAMAKANTSPLKTKSDFKALVKDSGRREIYSHSWSAFLENPLWGAGAGNYPVIYQKTDRTRTEYVRYAHSDPLQWLVETGLVGALAALGLAWALWKRMRGAEGPMRVAAATLVVTAVHSMVSYPFYKNIPAAWAFWAMGVLAWKEGVACYAPTQRQALNANHGVGAQHAAPSIAAITAILLLPIALAPWRSSRVQQEAFAPLQFPPTSPADAVERHRKVAEGLERALELQPHDPQLLWSRAVSLLRGGESAMAEALLGTLQALTPYNDRVHLLLAQLAAARGDQAARLSCLEKAFEVIPDSRPLLDELWVLLSWPDIPDREVRRDNLIAAYRRQGWWREREPELLAELGDTASLQDLVHAQVILEDRLLVEPRHAETLARLGLTQFRLGNVMGAQASYGRALEALDAAPALHKERPDLSMRVLLAQGNCLMQLGRPGEALPLFTRARKAFPREPRFLDQELRILMESGSWESLKGVIEEAAKAHGDERRVRLRALGLIESWMGGGELALLEALEQHSLVVEKYSDGPAFLGRGRFYLEKMKDVDAAREDLKKALEAGLSLEDRREAMRLLESLY